MNKFFSLFIILTTLFLAKTFAQNFTYRTSLKEMCGIPGDIFSCTVSFTNTSSSPINIFVNRYQKTTPAYWYSCFCYNQCNLPSRDTITISIPAFSTDMMVVQFKTDSVNPGFSDADFTVYQIGFQNYEDSFRLEASTMCNLAAGVVDFLESNDGFNLYPNPTSNDLNIDLKDETIQEIRIYDVVGRLIEKIRLIDSGNYVFNTKYYQKGIYFIELYSDKNKYTKRFVKN